ncbi:MAG: C1 family peptidase [Pseudoflavonifractor sp.]|nr:C1 family peptidase [Alloprevotella sp.]MCM1116066.1 C1 family peptidase [Pseudoflavonifractor sp.]
MFIRLLSLTTVLSLSSTAIAAPEVPDSIPLSTLTAAHSSGGLSTDDLEALRASFSPTGADRALYNAISNNDISKLAINTDARRQRPDDRFSHRVKSKGITNQMSSGRCWLFTGLNMLRAQMMADNNLPELKLSQNYLFFYDQLEKSNLFLQAVIDNASEPLDSKLNEWLFHHPLSDGGQFTGVADLIAKYGVVPAEVMPETNSSNRTSTMSRLIGLKLKEDGLELRRMAANGAAAASLESRKKEMLQEIYRMLALNLGVPPTEFEWTARNAKGEPVSTATYTPASFYRTFAGNDLQADYVMLMNDPSRPYWKLYEIDLDRHVYDGKNWTYINLPIEEIKKMAIASIKDSTAMYFSCDVGQQFDREAGLLDPDNYDYGSLLGVSFGMDKKDRIQTGASASSHAMTLVAVDLDKEGNPTKWLVENSWGPGANGGHLIMTDRWFDEYMFRLVVQDKYLTPEARAVLSQAPELLPAWDPMFAPED